MYSLCFLWWWNEYQYQYASSAIRVQFFHIEIFIEECLGISARNFHKVLNIFNLFVKCSFLLFQRLPRSLPNPLMYVVFVSSIDFAIEWNSEYWIVQISIYSTSSYNLFFFWKFHFEDIAIHPIESFRYVQYNGSDRNMKHFALLWWELNRFENWKLIWYEWFCFRCVFHAVIKTTAIPMCQQIQPTPHLIIEYRKWGCWRRTYSQTKRKRWLQRSRNQVLVRTSSSRRWRNGSSWFGCCFSEFYEVKNRVFSKLSVRLDFLSSYLYCRFKNNVKWTDCNKTVIEEKNHWLYEFYRPILEILCLKLDINK